MDLVTTLAHAPVQVMGCKVKDVILAHGVFMDRCDVENAIIGVRSRVEAGCKIKDAMIIGADYYQSEEQRAQLLAAGVPPVGIGAGTHISNAIIDKNVGIGKNCIITNAAGVQEVRFLCYSEHPAPLLTRFSGCSRSRGLLHSQRHRVRAAQRHDSGRHQDLEGAL